MRSANIKISENKILMRKDDVNMTISTRVGRMLINISGGDT
jgi:hypothetical protein